MKSFFQFIFKPHVFINQLQWSQNHFQLLIFFLVASVVETIVSGQSGSIHKLATDYSKEASDLNLWYFTFFTLRLTAIVIGAFLIGNIIWYLGQFFGKKNSRRVLFRRLAVVFTLFMVASIFMQLSQTYSMLSLFVWLISFWAILMGYLSLKEHFHLTSAEALSVWMISILFILSGWYFANHYFDDTSHSLTLKSTSQHYRAR